MSNTFHKDQPENIQDDRIFHGVKKQKIKSRTRYKDSLKEQELEEELIEVLEKFRK